jgi:DNA phosphorothioation-associated putative methyltransferase
MRTVNPSRTAIQRTALSRPVYLALQDGLISKERTVFDYGCGRGGDLLRLHEMGVPVSGWDPAFFPDEERTPADVVNLGYVVNVLEDPRERVIVLSAAWALTQKVLIVSARLEWEARRLDGDFHGDGIVTERSTFQKFFTQEELRGWIEQTLGQHCVAAAPGVFYVFREAAEEQTCLASRLTRFRNIPQAQLGEEAFETHQALLGPLMEFIAARGRVPKDTELDSIPQLRQVFGGVTAAFSLVRRVTGSDRWDRIRQERREDLLVYLALAAFGNRQPFGALEDSLGFDIRAFFGSYKKACLEADALLHSAGNQSAIDQACRATDFGKLLPDALYVHHSAVSRLPPLLRVYEGCGRQLIGAVEDMTLVKMARDRARVSYLVYQDFDRVAHPVLRESFIAELPRLRVHHRDYRQSANPPILHRKELVVTEDYPARKKFEKLTRQEERAGVLGDSSVGRKSEWEAHLAQAGYQCRGHRLVRRL